MEKITVLIIALIIFLGFSLLVWKLTNKDIKAEYGKKAWNHWPSRLYYWQGVVLYGVGLTLVVMLLLNWLGILNF